MIFNKQMFEYIRSINCADNAILTKPLFTWDIQINITVFFWAAPAPGFFLSRLRLQAAKKDSLRLPNPAPKYLLTSWEGTLLTFPRRWFTFLPGTYLLFPRRWLTFLPGTYLLFPGRWLARLPGPLPQVAHANTLALRSVKTVQKNLQ